MSPLNNKKILIVEDEPFLRETIADIFLMTGAQVEASENGLQALDQLSSSQFDIVISDVNMPVCNGIELMQKIKTLNGSAPICFLLTGHYSIGENELSELGVSKIFYKPFVTLELISDIENFVVGGKLRAG